MLERTEVEVLLTLAAQLHFGRTAERLRLSTAQVSRILKRVERRIGAGLFTRTSRSVALTPIGTALVERLAPHQAGIDAAVREAVEAGRGVSGTLRVGFFGAGITQQLLDAVTLLRTRHPDCELDIHEAQLYDAVDLVHGGTVDVLITPLLVPGPVSGLRVGPVLLTESQVLAVPADHPLAGQTEVSQEALGDHPVIQLPDTLPEEPQLFQRPATTPTGRPVRPGPTAGTIPAILALVATGQGVFPACASAARFYPRPGVVYVPMPDAPPVRWAPVWLPANETALIRAFVDCVAEVAGH